MVHLLLFSAVTTKPVSGWDVVRNGGLLLCAGAGYWSTSVL